MKELSQAQVNQLTNVLAQITKAASNASSASRTQAQPQSSAQPRQPTSTTGQVSVSPDPTDKNAQLVAILRLIQNALAQIKSEVGTLQQRRGSSSPVSSTGSQYSWGITPTDTLGLTTTDDPDWYGNAVAVQDQRKARIDNEELRKGLQNAAVWDQFTAQWQSINRHETAPDYRKLTLEIELRKIRGDLSKI